MNENTFVAVGRIERIMTSSRGLTLVIGGRGPVKSLVSVHLYDQTLVTLVTTPGSGFAPGDIVSASGKLEYCAETHQNLAIAAPDRVSRIARGVGHASPAAEGANLFGYCERPGARSASSPADPVPLPHLDFSTHLAGELVGLNDVHL